MRLKQFVRRIPLRGAIEKLYLLIEPQERNRFRWLLVLMVLSAFAQTAGVVSIMPFLSLVAAPETVESNSWLALAYHWSGAGSTERFLYYVGFFAFFLYLISLALQAGTSWITVRFSYSQQYYLSRRLMAGFLRRPYDFFLNRNSGDLAKTVLEETAQGINNALLPALRLISSSIVAAAMILVLLVANPLLALTVSGTLALFYGMTFLVARTWLERIGRDRVEANRERFTVVAEVFAGIKEILLLGRESAYLDRYRNPAIRFANHQANSLLLQDLPLYVLEGLAFGGMLLVVLYLLGGNQGLAGMLPIIGLYALAGKQLIPAFQKIFAAIASIRFTMPAVDNVVDQMNDLRQVDPRPMLATEFLAPQREIRIENLSYRYPGADRLAISNLSLTIPARTTVGFIGSSGAGKSTVVDLLLGLLQPEQGEILVDGVPLGADNIRCWQASIGYVPQHIFLADQSIAENIALGVPPTEIDQQAVEKAARLANLYDFVVQQLPQGLDTVIGERGVRLSGGQRQRIGIARALYRNPAVLLFDEATSALDNTTEKVVMEAIHNLAGEKTIILVAHRLTTVEPCAKVFLLDNGCLVAEGAWETISESVFFRRYMTAPALAVDAAE
ncbi:Xenobiotic-transporting ATPase [Thiorhodococcus drewsii AZ1]|uniref:Xenobiotic-transporting ATPase n=1 Tax=Thiorhodococcus drewsii AZ1 TaxID=765913 RepID=G2E890_9GAMM|nr:ABC transporter ATP-binding protein [Thiorhodococcus drewsii]EGV27683.1 Xenobiotic-transporting ATPase [Thiorhodococcus drewsii AZ1]